MPTYPLFATTPKGMEDILVAELQALGIAHPKATLAGVAFEGDLETAYRICLWSRIASRVLLVISAFSVRNQQDLYDGVQQTDWFLHINPEDTIAVNFNAKNAPAINNTHFGALKVKDAIVDQMRGRFNVRPGVDTERPNLRIHVYLQGESAQLSLDLSGDSLHRRGYRDTGISAPLKENLAAALLLRAGWPKIAAANGTLLDPMCGSGTLLLEGAMMAADYAPGLGRDYFGFTGWKKHDAPCWAKLCAEAQRRKQAGIAKLPVIVGFDQDLQTVKIALQHAANLGLQHKIHIERRDITDAAPAASWPPGLLICNPPYGERLEDEDSVAELYEQFGETLKSHFLGWQAAIIISNPELGFRFGIRSQKPVTLFNGALECKLLRMDIAERAFFIPKPRVQPEREELVTELAELLHESVGADMFANRLKKNLKNLAKWARRYNITCYRIYDADLPEYAAAVDLYHGERTWAVVQEYEPPKTIDPEKANQRLAALLAELPKALGIESGDVFLKIRRKQRSTGQYEKIADSGQFHQIQEGDCTLLVNFSDYLDTGLFLDHRPIRWRIQHEAKGKRFLNLFAYTGSATVHAAVGGAIATTTVDMSNTYINWAKQNLALNATTGEHEFIQADCLEWLAHEAAQTAPRQYGLIFLDPPTFSNSKRMDEVFDIQKDHVQLILMAAKLLENDGVLYFSTNFRRFKLERTSLPGLIIDDISADTIPKDFARNPKIHYCWRMVKPCVE